MLSISWYARYDAQQQYAVSGFNHTIALHDELYGRQLAEEVAAATGSEVYATPLVVTLDPILDDPVVADTTKLLEFVRKLRAEQTEALAHYSRAADEQSWSTFYKRDTMEFVDQIEKVIEMINPAKQVATLREAAKKRRMIVLNEKGTA